MRLLKAIRVLTIITMAILFSPYMFQTFSPATVSGLVSYNPQPGSAFHAPLSDMGLLDLVQLQGNLSTISNPSIASSSVSSASSTSGLAGGMQTISQKALRFINDTSYFPQSETAVAVDPANPNHVLGGFNDAKFLFCPVFPQECASSGFPASLSGFTVSIDGGLSVLKGSDIPAFNITEVTFPPPTGPMIPFGDPAIAPSGDGNFFFSSLGASRDGGNGILLAKSNSNLFDPNVSCVTSNITPISNACWSEIFVDGRTSIFAPTLEDKPVMAVDHSNGPYSGSVYIGWDHFTFDRPTSSSYLARCQNDLSSCTMLSGGHVVVLSDTDLFPAFTTPAVDRNGNVYVMWCDYGTFTTFGPVTCKVRSSPPGGTSFGPPSTILSFMGPGTTLPDDNVIQGFATEQFRTASIPWLASDTSQTLSSGNLYFTIPVCTFGRYLGAPLLSGDNPGDCGLSSIIFAASSNGGVTWSSPSIVSKPAVNTQPYITVDPSTGNIFVVYYTTQFDPFNHRIDVVASKSTNGGSTFHQSRITSASNEPNSDPNMFFYAGPNGGSWAVPQYGDYLQATAQGGKLWVLFTANYAVEQGTFQTDPFLARATL